MSQNEIMNHDVFLTASQMLTEMIRGLEPALNGYTETGDAILPGNVDYVDAEQFSLVMMNQILDAFNNRDIPLPTKEMELEKYAKIVEIATTAINNLKD